MSRARTAVRCGVFLAVSAVASALLGGCLSDGDLRARCAGGPVCVESQVEPITRHTWDFEGGCIGDGCDVQPMVNRPSYGPSWHPSDRALVLPAGTSVSLPFVHIALSDGTELSLNARCAEGATLWLDGDSMWDGRTPLQLSAPQGWHRVVHTLTSPTTVRASPGEVVRGQHAYALRLRASGSGECAVDRVEHRVLARVCQRWSPTLEQCLRVGGWDAGNWGDDDVPQARDAGAE